MRQVNFRLTALAILLAVFGAACNRDKKAEQLAALDRGFEAGLLTRSEYDAKKAIILGTGTPPAAVPGPATPAPPAVAAPAQASPPPAPEPVTPPPAASAPSTPPPVASTRSTPPHAASTAPARRAAASAPSTPPPAASTPSTPPPASPEPSTPAPAAQPDSAPRRSPPGEDAGEEPTPLAGCQDTVTKPGKEKGKQERFFPMPVARVKSAAIGALEALEFKVNKDSGREIEATKKRHIGVLVGSGGEKMVLRFEDASEGGQSGTLVIGETKKGFLLRAGQKSWTNAILTQTGCTLRKASR